MPVLTRKYKQGQVKVKQMTNGATFYQYTSKRIATSPVSAAPAGEIKQWGVILVIIVVGLLALGILLVAGGVFATIGPWVIFAGALVFAKRSERRRRVL
jgi:hypothetical protein